MFRQRDIVFILVALCFLIYANSLNNAFVSDDIPAILKNPAISQAHYFWLVPDQLFNSLNYRIAKFNPFIYHLTNIAIHSINTLLVFFFLQLFFKSQASFLGAILFAVHPIHTEAVTWISGRPYLFLAFFILITYLLYQAATGRDTKFKVTPYFLSLLIFAYFILKNFSFYSLFPFLLILSDVTFKTWRRNWKCWLPFFAIVILRLILAKAVIMGRVTSVAKDIAGAPTWTNPLFNLVYSLSSHFFLLLWPAKLTLYHEPALISAFQLKIGIISLTILILALPFIFKRAKEIFFAIVLFILFLAPTYSPITISWLVAERYLYFPSVSLSMFLAFFYERFIAYKPHLRNIALGFLLFIIAGYGLRTVARNEDWKTPGKLWRQTLKVSYNSPRSHNNMGDIYAQEGNLEGAIQEFKKAVELKPDYADAYHNLANTYYHKGDLQQAIKLYQQALLFNPKLFDSYYNLGIIYLNTGNLDLAIKQFQKALQLNPQDANAQRALNFALRQISVDR